MDDLPDELLRAIYDMLPIFNKVIFVYAYRRIWLITDITGRNIIGAIKNKLVIPILPAIVNSGGVIMGKFLRDVVMEEPNNDNIIIIFPGNDSNIMHDVIDNKLNIIGHSFKFDYNRSIVSADYCDFIIATLIEHRTTHWSDEITIFTIIKSNNHIFTYHNYNWVTFGPNNFGDKKLYFDGKLHVLSAAI